MRVLTLVALAQVLVCAAAPARAQPLAEVARQEAERRKTVKDGGKVITNKDLPKRPIVPTGAASDTATAAPATSAKTPSDTKAGQAAPAAADEATSRDQAYWAGRRESLQEQLDRDQTLADALQSRINGLTTDFVNRDDPAQRTVIANDRQKALAEIDRLKKAIVNDKKALADFEEEARRAGVPPGWLR